MGYLYTAFVIGVAVAIKGILNARWERFKEDESLKPQQMEMRKGIYVPWGRVQKIQRWGYVWLGIWLVYMAVIIGLVIYSSVIGRQLF